MHFALEERIMRDAGYEEYEGHKEDHEDLLDEIRDLMDAFLADAENGGRLLKERLSAWFAKHFASFDARLHGQLGPH
jgi:hemerythrin-like metal-binding protein